MKKIIFGLLTIHTIAFSYYGYYEVPPTTYGSPSDSLSESETKSAVRLYNEIKDMSGSEYDYNQKIDEYNHRYGGKSAYDPERVTRELNNGFGY